MTTASPAPPIAVSSPRAEARVGVVPWYLSAVVLASSCVIVGLLWDISWHRTIGRDRLITPPHAAIYLGAVIAGFACGALALKTTFAGSAEERATSVSFWGFRAPLGAWLCIWGSFAMLTSAPFDNWWHNAYGLDVQILSPPHTVLGIGMIGIEIGAMLMVLAHQNRAGATASRALRWMYVYCAGIALLMIATMVWEYTGFANSMHGSLFYQIAAAAFPLFMIAPARAGKLRGSAAAVAAVYMGLTLAMVWILPLFPATAKLAPIYNPVTHMVPPTFPLILIVPAIGFDLLMRHIGEGRDGRLALVLGVAFVLTLLVVQWTFAEFLLTPAARNAFFAADRWGYDSRLGPWRHKYWDLDLSANGAWSRVGFVRGMLVALGVGVATSRIGLAWGRWMAGVKR